MATGPFITDSMRARMDRQKRTAFNRMIKNTRQPTVIYFKHQGNSVNIPSMGEAIPSFPATGQSVDALDERVKDPQTRTQWGVDPRTISKRDGNVERVICMMTEDVESLGVTTRDRFTVQGVHEATSTLYHVAYIRPCSDMGHEIWMTKIGLRHQTQTPE